MPISTEEVIVGGEYVTDSDQLRKVTEIVQDTDGQTRVHYDSKSAKYPYRNWLSGHTKENAPLLDAFAEVCERKTN